MEATSRQSVELAVQRTITASALAGERVVSVARLLFCLAVGIRSGYYWASTSVGDGHETARALITYPALALAIGFSVAMLLGLGRNRVGLMLHLSVALDAVVAFVALVQNGVWPASEYQGAPYMSDTSAILLLTMCAGLRHSASAAALGGALNMLSYAGLTVVDHVASGTSVPDHAGGYTMYGIMLAGAAGIALIIAVRTRRVVERAARAAVAAEQAGQGLRTVLRDHHDLRTVITSAQINADLLARSLSDEATAELVNHLRDDLGEIRVQLEQVKGHALEELAGLQSALPAAIGPAAAEVVAALQPRFPAVVITAAADDSPPALVAGGVPTLRRILANLVVNACEGDGSGGARRVDVRARACGTDRVAIEVDDDGPGLPAHVLAVPAGDAASTKAAGSGFGIGLVEGMVKASGGTMVLSNQAGGGAPVVIELPTASR